MRIPDPTSRVWIDGTSVPADQATVSIDDPGLLAGLGLFETLALRRGRVLDLLPHLERMQRGAVLLGIELPPRQRLLDTVEQAAAQVSETPFAWLKIMALRSGTWLVFTGSMSAGEEGREVSAIVLPWRRDSRDPLVTVKSTCYAGHQLGLELARRRGADEGLWLNGRGHLSEGCTSNLFVVRHHRLFTPSLHEGDPARRGQVPRHRGVERAWHSGSRDSRSIEEIARGRRSLPDLEPIRGATAGQRRRACRGPRRAGARHPPHRDPAAIDAPGRLGWW